MKKVVLAADLGGTNLRIAAVDSDGAILHLVKRPVPHNVAPSALIEQIREMADECCVPSTTEDQKRDYSAIAFTAPAPVAKDFDGVLTKLPNLPSLVGMNLKTELQDLFGIPVTVENDATAAGIGEHWIGASQGLDNVVCVTLGTGIGGGIIISGEAIRGKDGIGGEIGHVCVEPDGHPCGCGSHGCIEQYASATAIVRVARERGMDVATAKDVYDAFVAGNGMADAVFRGMGRHLGITLAGLANTLNPEMFVICGGVTQGWDAFAPHVASEIKLRAYPAAAARATLVKGSLGDNAGLLGTARSAFLALQD
ncbi:MAG: ROK family protein [Pyrinomonadaceae bacterium]